MKKRPEVFLAHIQEAIERIEAYVAGSTKNAFLKDLKTQDAVIRQLAVLGEAANQVPAQSVQDSPIPWHAIVGMRHRLVHDYMGVDLEIVWTTVKQELPKLRRYLKRRVAT
jgi:uncharacterized protein with HEPN domain